MYICLCNNIRDSELRALAKDGVRKAEHAYAALGNHPKCGACLQSAQEVIDETRGALPARGKAVA
jgi:bacterioferritin-associated ferredoxin